MRGPEPTERYRKEAQFEKSMSTKTAKVAKQFAKANPGVIIRGGGSRFLTVETPENDLTWVAFTKRTRITSGGMQKTLSYTIRTDHADNEEPTYESFNKRRAAEARFEEVIPEYSTRRSISVGIPGYEAPSYDKQAKQNDLTLPAELKTT